MKSPLTGDWGERHGVKTCFEGAPQTGQFFIVECPWNHCFFTPKRNRNRSSNSEPSPEENKRLKKSNSPAESSSDEEAVMEAIVNKLDVVLSKLTNLETQFEELNTAVKSGVAMQSCFVGS